MPSFLCGQLGRCIFIGELHLMALSAARYVEYSPRETLSELSFLDKMGIVSTSFQHHVRLPT
jgi:hypothetical protein